jgi:hypothetical protein
LHFFFQTPTQKGVKLTMDAHGLIAKSQIMLSAPQGPPNSAQNSSYLPL